MPKPKNNAVVVDACAQRLKALQAHVSAATEIAINGARYTLAEGMAIFQASLDTRSALVKSRAQVTVDLAARGKAEDRRVAFEVGLKPWVIAQFGADSNEALEFGYAARKEGTKTADTVANAVKLAKATREARHTMGSRAKKKIKGTLETKE